MTKKTLTAQQLLESIEKGGDDSASDSDDSIELRYETEDEEAKEVENEDEYVLTLNLQTEKAQPAFPLIRSETVEMIDQIDSQIEIIPDE
jgi:hypothetical protein